MYIGYKYQLRPNKEQDLALDFLLWQARTVYNAALEQRIQVYKETGKTLNLFSQWAWLREHRHNNPDTIGKLNCSCCHHILRRLDKGYAMFFRAIQGKEAGGPPKFRSRKQFSSMEFTYADGCKLRFGGNGKARLYVQNAGLIRMCFHRPIPEDATIKQVVIKRKNRCWYANLMLEKPDPEPLPRPISGIGIDFGLKSLITTSDGMQSGNPRWMKNELARLRVLQRRGTRRKKGGSRRAKAFLQVNLLHEKIANKRKDYYHKLTRYLVDQYSLIAIEDLPLAFMNQNRKLSRTSFDASFCEFRTILEAKAAAAGTQVIAVSPYNTSQRCSECGELVEKNLDVRVHACPHCGLVLDRDVNAARNILQAALAQINQ
jgi:putative transposase